MQEILLLSDKYKELREAKKRLDAQVKDLNQEIEQVEYALSQLMTDEELQKFDRDGTLFYLSTRAYASPAAGRKDDLHAWLKENGYGDLVKESVHANTLSAFIKELLEEGELPEDLAGVVNVYEKTTVNMRRAGR